MYVNENMKNSSLRSTHKLFMYNSIKHDNCDVNYNNYYDLSYLNIFTVID